jgi:hypothetical protein
MLGRVGVEGHGGLTRRLDWNLGEPVRFSSEALDKWEKKQGKSKPYWQSDKPIVEE